MICFNEDEDLNFESPFAGGDDACGGDVLHYLRMKEYIFIISPLCSNIDL